MKDHKWLWMLALFIFIITGCQNHDSDLTSKEVKNELNADVVDTHGGVDGLDNMETFYQQVQKNKEADLRVIHYTTEGDAIVTDLTYDGQQINVEDDSTRDQFGSGSVILSVKK